MDGLDHQPESSSTLSPGSGLMEFSDHTSTSSSVSHALQEDEEAVEEDNAEFEAVRTETFTCSVSEATCACISLLTTTWFLGCFLTLHVNIYI